MVERIRIVFTWQGMKQQVIDCCKYCHQCQLAKKCNKIKYGLVPEKVGKITKWNQINFDLWGPKLIKNVNDFDYEIHIMTMVNPATRWPKFAQLYSLLAYYCQNILDSIWLSSYPRPKEICMDNGNKFKKEFLVISAKTWDLQRKKVTNGIHNQKGYSNASIKCCTTL